MNKRTTDEWKNDVEPALLSKIHELKIIGYAGVTKEELWLYLNEKVWVNNPKKLIHEMIQDILRFPPSDYINYLTVEALTVQKGKADLMESIRALTEPKA